VTKLHTCDMCNSRTENVAKLFEATEQEIFLCKECVENAWLQIYEKESNIEDNLRIQV